MVSARQLPKPGGAQKGEIIDPYVIVSMHGVPSDCRKAKSTKVIQDNGFNPVWNETYTFEVGVYVCIYVCLYVGMCVCM